MAELLAGAALIAKVEEAIERTGLDHSAFAALAGIDQSDLSKLLRGEKSFGPKRIRRIAKAGDMPYEAFTRNGVAPLAWVDTKEAREVEGLLLQALAIVQAARSRAESGGVTAADADGPAPTAEQVSGLSRARGAGGEGQEAPDAKVRRRRKSGGADS